MVNRKVLCVAEKNDAAKNIAAIMSNSSAIYRDGPARYNKLYCFDGMVLNQQSSVVFTSVSGHLKAIDFPPNMKSWANVPFNLCFTAPVVTFVPEGMKTIEQQLIMESRQAQVLIIWTDCDREGENIGAEVIDVCRRANPRLDIWRARFSEITRLAVTNALGRLVRINDNEVDAVNCRIELDLRIGAAFTRLQTLFIQREVPIALPNEGNSGDRVVSYGSCQFPTMGFIVYRYLENSQFIPETFWKLTGKDTEKNVDFAWARNRLFDELVVQMYLEICVGTGTVVANVSEITKLPKIKYRPYALHTVELEKLGVRKLKMSAKRTLTAAEKLYTQGYISYPRTETNLFPPDLPLDDFIQAQTTHPLWGEFAGDILHRGGANPNNGRKSDAAHPPIHPLKIAKKEELRNPDEWAVYELVVRHFLACCSRNATGSETKVTIKVKGETFIATGLTIEDMGYMEVYPYDKWTAREIPQYQVGEVIVNFQIAIRDGSTTAPMLLTEADLITLMDKYGIGTDATHAEHIHKIQERNYVKMTTDRRFKPTFLGMALVDGYNHMGQELLSRPHLRAGLERELEDIVQGRKTRAAVLASQIQIYRNIFSIAERNIDQLAASLHQFISRMPD